MCKWSDRPRGRNKRKAWLKRYVVVLQKRLNAGFPEAWFKKKHWTPQQQRKECAAKLVRATKELETLA